LFTIFFSGMPEFLLLRDEGFPIRLRLSDFVKNFSPLLNTTNYNRSSDLSLSQTTTAILNSFMIPSSSFSVGLNSVFMKESAASFLNQLYRDRTESLTKIAQACLSSRLLSNEFRTIEKGTKNCQVLMRIIRAKRVVKKLRMQTVAPSIQGFLRIYFIKIEMCFKRHRIRIARVNNDLRRLFMIKIQTARQTALQIAADEEKTKEELKKSLSESIPMAKTVASANLKKLTSRDVPQRVLESRYYLHEKQLITPMADRQPRLTEDGDNFVLSLSTDVRTKQRKHRKDRITRKSSYFTEQGSHRRLASKFSGDAKAELKLEELEFYCHSLSSISKRYLQKMSEEDQKLSDGMQWVWLMLNRMYSVNKKKVVLRTKEYILSKVDPDKFQQESTKVTAQNPSNLDQFLHQALARQEEFQVDFRKISLDTVMSDPEFRQSFSEFLARQFCHENFRFFTAVEEYKCITYPNSRRYKAKEIYTKFISVGGPQSVNLDADSRRRTTANIVAGRFRVDLFDEANAHIHRMVEKDVFKRYLHSEAFLELVTNRVNQMMRSGKITKGEGWVNKEGYKSLKVKLCEARDLIRSKKPVYCLLSVDSRVLKSSALRNEHQIVWNEEFTFPILSTSQFFEINFRSNSGKRLGRVIIPFEMLNAPFSPAWYKLVPSPDMKIDTIQGEVLLHLALSTDIAHGRLETIADQNKPRYRDVDNAKQERIFKEDGFVLDLAYITERIIAFADPSKNMQGYNKDPVSEVARFFNSRHHHCYRLYNLSCFSNYDLKKFDKDSIIQFPIYENSPCEFSKLVELCREIDLWLNSHPQNIVAIHCDDGKERTGLVVCCLLMYRNVWKDARSAMEFYGASRTKDMNGVSIPSLVRYVRYMEQFLRQDDDEKEPRIPNDRVLRMKKLLVKNPSHKIEKHQKSLTFLVNQAIPLGSSEIDSALVLVEHNSCMEFSFHEKIFVKDDVRIDILTYDSSPVVTFWFNTRFIADKMILKSEVSS
jgi:protein-tyrosine phosphatase